MEQRKAPRKTAGIGAVVSCPQFGLFRGEIDNLSLQGVYLRTSAVSVCLNAPVTVTFQSQGDNPACCCNAEGVVVRQDRGGIGVRFSALDGRNQAILSELIQHLPTCDEAVATGLPERLAV